MSNILSKAWDSFVRSVNPDVDSIIAAFVKAQKNLEVLISREMEALAVESGVRAALERKASERNATIDRAYRIINNIDGLVA